MPLVDGITWHVHGIYPETGRWAGVDFPEGYYEYPSIVQEIIDIASAHGFEGEYIADEIQWLSGKKADPGEPLYSEIIAAKYFARGIIMNQGMDITTGLSGTELAFLNLPKMRVIHYGWC